MSLFRCIKPKFYPPKLRKVIEAFPKRVSGITMFEIFLIRHGYAKMSKMGKNIDNKFMKRKEIDQNLISFQPQVFGQI